MKKLALSGMVAVCLAAGSPSTALTFGTEPISFADLPENFDVIDAATLEAHEVWANAKVFLGVAGPRTAGKLDYPEVLASRSGDVGGTNTSVVGIGPSVLEFIYLGSEAAFGNTAYLGDTLLFGNGFSTFGDRREVAWSGGRLDFRFCSDRGTLELSDDGCVSNDPAMNTGMATELEIAVSRIFRHLGKDSAIFFFGDGVSTNDADLDDMVVAARLVTAVPLPAGLLLLGTAALGLGGLSARRGRRRT